MTGNLHQTIAALATPAGESGLAVIRVSGPGAIDVLSSIVTVNGKRRSPDAWKHRRTYHGEVVSADGEVVDDVICAVARAPESYTGEDAVELSCHGNTLLVSRILELMYANGARAADAGEFTKRAFLNGKMDLIQAEAVADLIHARSELQRKVAREQLAGRLSERIHALADDVLGILGVVEANIDFIEEDIDTLDVEATLDRLAAHRQALDGLLENSGLARPFHEGYRVAIAGPVNAGKSSLFNTIVGASRAIVTEVPGTTRDVLREALSLDGLLFMFQDTAGLRGTEDRVERMGVDRAREALGQADIILYVVDGSAAPPPEWSTELALLPVDETLIVVNKSDLDAHSGWAFGDFPAAQIIHTSAVEGSGLDVLRKSLVARVGVDRLNWIARERIVLNARLIADLGEARRRIDALIGKFRERAPLEILAIEAREALHVYESATGRRYSDGLLDTIFARFCIGK
jgi:tRNA modification GTPase